MPPSASTLERLVRRDRAVVGTAVALLALLAWAYVIRLAAHMTGDAAGSEMATPAMMGPELKEWSAADGAFMFIMWAVMMTAMMTPSVGPMVLIHARVARQALVGGKPFAATGWFAAGYLLAWTGVAAAATAAQWLLEHAALLTPGMHLSNALGGAVLIAAGLYQWTPLKDACLAQCQAPLVFIQQHGGFRADTRGSLLLGGRHGLYCIGCCWALMALLFVGGVMNVLWIAAIAVFILLEKLAPWSRALSRGAAATFILAGLWFVSASFE